MYLTIILIVITLIISYKGLTDPIFIDKYSFNTEKVLVYKEYIRFISSGFLHVSWPHLIINMIVLYAFGSGLEVAIGAVPYLVIYFISLLGGNLFALWIHKHDSGYSSAGASGAISGLVFATIALFPQWGIGFFFLPIHLPGWVYGVLYVLYTVYAIRSRKTDVGHAAHLGGALIGMAAALLMFPQVLLENWLPVLAISLPAIALIVIMIRKPELILIDRKTQERQLTVDDRYNIRQHNKKLEVDRILEKINEKGINSLTHEEKKLLDEYSRS